eukprot:1156846-Pelagomonas_calceolata.AAC.5
MPGQQGRKPTFALCRAASAGSSSCLWVVASAGWEAEVLRPHARRADVIPKMVDVCRQACDGNIIHIEIIDLRQHAITVH